MDEAFMKERALHIRNLAEKADPFIKRRLLDLAASYESRLGRPSQASMRASFKPSVRKKLRSRKLSPCGRLEPLRLLECSRIDSSIGDRREQNSFVSRDSSPGGNLDC